MRQAIRVAAQMQLAPAAILDTADRSLRSEYRDAVVTAFVGVVDHTEDVIAFANAGHPAPLLRDADGVIHELRADGLPLGLRDLVAAERTVTAPFPLGATLVLYTDGLTEARRDYSEGERRLHEAVAHAKPAGTNHTAQTVAAAVLREGSRDDVAILVVRNQRRGAPADRWSFDVTDPAAAYRVRDEIVTTLTAHGASEDDTHVAAMVYSELIANVHKHAGNNVEVFLDWNDRQPVLHVLDEGDGYSHVPRPQSDLAESGRGLFIVDTLASGFTIEPRLNSGSHARAVLPLTRTRADRRPDQP
jgi:anti-sigma regulatory factor (Ser/Thr protein kinase)